MSAYYNEWDKKSAAWLRVLIDRKLIAPGEVDERSITAVTADDLKGFRQCHFFAGIGGWSLALRLSGIPDDQPIWTGSPPCQPFSVAGHQKGKLDDRHLSPAFLALIEQCHPPVVFGEQVNAAISKGWLDDLFTELEKQGYGCASSVLPAASVGAPHQRYRLFFGAHQLANATSTRYLWGANATIQTRYNPQSEYYRELSSRFSGYPLPDLQPASELVGLVDTDHQRLQRQWPDGYPQGWQEPDVRQAGLRDRTRFTDAAYSNFSYWSDADWLGCRDGKFRPIEPGAFPLADGIPARVGRLRGYGNAIVPPLASEFINAFFEAILDSFDC
ncbi:DNA cytosine methyltransferase [Pantoea sp. Al-1710]|uniref:DNA (cytosine-5-)-methyltransferase n=1 Tax=Candidatus Pantoea communis TaxID=2608354 RepID=A0ABX0RNL5_9GAMM|nr:MULTISPECIES: DNA cytosine methyltransferase [Pantoea]NIG12975.1 DNA cytosine methyltransferase [Pantoea sp. Cy-640]NIG17324.1 DNA cytosine methyltransferase [Pantoea communis]